MNNIAEKLNLIVDYIEKNLDGEIDKEKLARLACCSYYDVGRMFSLIAGISLSEYIRKRRMTHAAVELSEGRVRVIDVAVKYGYDSHISFARAFQAFHGFNPGELDRDGRVYKVFPRMIFKIQVEGVVDMLKKDRITVDGKEYEASYFGEIEMASWSSEYSKRRYWRLENAYEDMKNKQALHGLLPYNNYPPINIEEGQVFVIDYYTKDGGVERKYYVADGTVWQDMLCTREIAIAAMEPLLTERLTVGGKEYDASYFGEMEMESWSPIYLKRKYWRLENAYEDVKNNPPKREVLPYNNYPPIDFKEGQVFVIDYYTKDGGVERKCYIADGSVWRDMPCTREIEI